MRNPKEMAEKIVQRYVYRTYAYVEIDDAKQCAVIAVDELREHSCTDDMNKYWQEVEQEINKL